MIFTGIGKYDADHIVVTVMHKSLSAQSDVELGQAIVDLRTVVLSPSIESDAWYMLQQRTGMRHEVSGRIRIECTYFISDSNNIVLGVRMQKMGVTLGTRQICSLELSSVGVLCISREESLLTLM